jgi:YesN/AraC family two-component response regulator
MFLRRSLVSVLGVMALAALPSMARAQASPMSQRLAALQQQNAFRQQQSAVQNAAQQTAILVQTVNQQNGLAVQSVMPTSTSFLQQQMALQSAMAQTRALLQTSQQRNPALSRTALGQLNTLQAVLQQSAFLQAALQTQSNLLTPAQLLLLSQEQPSLSRLLTIQPAALPTTMPGPSSH